MPGVHLYGKGRVGDGLVSATWVTGTEPALVGHRGPYIVAPPCEAFL